MSCGRKSCQEGEFNILNYLTEVSGVVNLPSIDSNSFKGLNKNNRVSALSKIFV